MSVHQSGPNPLLALCGRSWFVIGSQPTGSPVVTCPDCLGKINHQPEVETFPFQVGDEITGTHWTTGNHITVLHVGRERFFARDRNGAENSYPITERWERYVRPVTFPETWFNFHDTGDGEVYFGQYGRTSELQARQAAEHEGGLVGILHLRSNGTTEMLPPES